MTLRRKAGELSSGGSSTGGGGGEPRPPPVEKPELEERCGVAKLGRGCAATKVARWDVAERAGGGVLGGGVLDGGVLGGGVLGGGVSGGGVLGGGGGGVRGGYAWWCGCSDEVVLEGWREAGVVGSSRNDTAAEG